MPTVPATPTCYGYPDMLGTGSRSEPAATEPWAGNWGEPRAPYVQPWFIPGEHVQSRTGQPITLTLLSIVPLMGTQSRCSCLDPTTGIVYYYDASAIQKV